MPVTDKQRSSKRPQIDPVELAAATTAVSKKMLSRLAEKGWGTWASRHEILGMTTEEYHEFIQAVHSESLDRVRAELIDLAVGCIFGVACIDAGKLEW